MCGGVSNNNPVRTNPITSPETGGVNNGAQNPAKPSPLSFGDSVSRGGGTSCAQRAPAMPGGGDIDELLSQIAQKNNGKDRNYDTNSVQSVNQAAAASTATNGSAGTDAGSDSGSGGSNPLGGMMNQLMQGVMGMLKSLLGGLLGGGGGGGIMSMLGGL